MTVSIYDGELKACCGARFFALFGNCSEWENTDIGKKWKGDKGRKDLIKELEYKIKTWIGQKFLIAILNDEQWENIGEIFIELKFKLVACGNNGGKGKPLFLLVYFKYEQGVKKKNAKKRVAKGSKESAGMAFF